MPLVGPGKGRVSNVYRIKEAVGPCRRFHRLKHDRLALVTNPHGGRGNVKAFRQAHGLAIPFVDDGCCFHNGIRSLLLLRMPIYHVSRLGVKLRTLLPVIAQVIARTAVKQYIAATERARQTKGKRSGKQHPLGVSLRQLPQTYMRSPLNAGKTNSASFFTKYELPCCAF